MSGNSRTSRWPGGSARGGSITGSLKIRSDSTVKYGDLSYRAEVQRLGKPFLKTADGSIADQRRFRSDARGPPRRFLSSRPKFPLRHRRSVLREYRPEPCRVNGGPQRSPEFRP